MQKIIYSSEFFNVKDTLDCGQVFRFTPFKNGFLVHALNKVCYAYQDGENAVIECDDADKDFFYNYFDLDRDYSKIYASALLEPSKALNEAAKLGKGIRILNQDKTEALFSFIVSQNNNIPRIKGIIERLCATLGEKVVFDGETYYGFPKIDSLAEKDENFYKSIGLGYRAEYIRRLAVDIQNGFNILEFESLPTVELKKRLISIHGVGPKVADCAVFFGYHRSDAFPVDTWIEKVYREDFDGKLTDRAKIASWFVDKFGQNSGYYQQYLFYYKRIKENNA